MMNRLVNLILFNALWPVCVVGAASAMVWPGVLLTLGFFVWQINPSVRQPGDRRLILLCVVIGTLLDTVWIQLGWLNYASALPWPGIAPVWISALWVGFALAINHSLQWMQRYPLLMASSFFILAPFSYFMAQNVGAVQWQAPTAHIVLGIGLSWSVFVAILLLLAKHWRTDLDDACLTIGN